MNLGDRVKDKITGFTGIVTARTAFLNGCIRCGVTAEKLPEDGKPSDPFWFDEPQLELIQAKVIPEGNHIPGGPMPFIPKRQPDAKR